MPLLNDTVRHIVDASTHEDAVPLAVNLADAYLVQFAPEALAHARAELVDWLERESLQTEQMERVILAIKYSSNPGHLGPVVYRHG